LSVLSRFFHALANECSPQAADQLRSLHNALVQSAHLGDVRMNELYNRLRNTSPTLARVPIGLHYRIGLLVRVLERSAVIGFRVRPGRSRDRCDRACCAAIAAICDSLIDPGLPEPPSMPSPSACSPWLLDICTELQQYRSSLISPQETDSPRPTETAPVRPSFRKFLPAAFQSAEQIPYALKLTLAAAICYIVYNAVDWPGIHTCVITVLFTGLSPTGQMKQRQAYRFVGTAIGGFFTIAAEALLFPNMDSITALVCLVAAVAFISGWVLRSPHIGAVGIQIGFAFFLTTLQEFRATTQIANARDRVIGVALGTIVMWFIFDQIWPTRTSQALNRILHRIQHASSLLHHADLRHKHALFAQTLSRLRLTVSLDLASMQQLESAAYFDFGRGHLRELANSRRLVRSIEAAASEFYTEALYHRSNEASPSE
jgi:multidrug resistance protein MdtO